jgi:hypothetical protein
VCKRNSQIFIFCKLFGNYGKMYTIVLQMTQSESSLFYKVCIGVHFHITFDDAIKIWLLRRHQVNVKPEKKVMNDTAFKMEKPLQLINMYLKTDWCVSEINQTVSRKT